MKGFFAEFKKFAMRGNVIDLAVGVIIGGAFGKITTSLVDDVLMPPLNLLTGRVDFNQLFIPLTNEAAQYSTLQEAREAGAAVIAYGSLFNALLQFVLLAFAVFVMVRAINKLQDKPEEGADKPVARNCPFCVSTIDPAAIRCPHCTSEIPPLPETATA